MSLPADQSSGIVTSVNSRATHSFSKRPAPSIQLLEGLGVEGDAHMGQTVQHRSRVRKDPTQPNLRQVHLMHAELFDELRQQGFEIAPGDLGENVTTRGIDLLALCVGARLGFSRGPIVELTGLRNPCGQIEQFQDGLLRHVLYRDDAGNLVRKAGVMGIVVRGGEIRPADVIEVDWPVGTRMRLMPV